MSHGPVGSARLLFQYELRVEAHPYFIKTVATAVSMLGCVLRPPPDNVEAFFRNRPQCICRQHIEATIYIDENAWVTCGHSCAADDGNVFLKKKTFLRRMF